MFSVVYSDTLPFTFCAVVGGNLKTDTYSVRGNRSILCGNCFQAEYFLYRC